MAIQITCQSGISNFFIRARPYIDEAFREIEGITPVWEGMIKSSGLFPREAGGQARTTVMGIQRPRLTTIKWNPQVGMQPDCVVTCNVSPNQVQLGNGDNRWYRLYDYSEIVGPYCLKSMWLDAMNLPTQIKHIFMNMKARTVDIMDDFYRTNYIALSSNKWIGVDNGTNNPFIGKVLPNGNPPWQFAQDVNGQPIINKIIIDPSIMDSAGTPTQVALLSVEELNFIRESGGYLNAFSATGDVPVITDWDTMSYLPKYDTNVRADNRRIDEAVLDPALGAVHRYAGYAFKRDPYVLRYRWDLNDPNYPNGVLTRVEQWHSVPLTQGCWDDVNPDYLNADFQITIPWNDNVFSYQNADYPTDLPDMKFEQPLSPYTGIWQFFNEVNEVTPCNSERNLGYWRMLLSKAAKPEIPQLGHVILHRRFNMRNVFKSCRPFMVPVLSYTYCNTTCAPFDAYAPALVSRVVCGSWNQPGIGCS
jgi:hypothetical protein